MDAEKLDTERALSFLPRALARLCVAEPEEIHAALVEACHRLGPHCKPLGSCPCCGGPPQMLGIGSPNMLTQLTRQGLLQKSNFHHEELGWLAWSAATLSSGLEFSCTIQAKTVARILQNSARHGLSACAKDLQAAQASLEHRRSWQPSTYCQEYGGFLRGAHQQTRIRSNPHPHVARRRQGRPAAGSPTSCCEGCRRATHPSVEPHRRHCQPAYGPSPWSQHHREG